MQQRVASTLPHDDFLACCSITLLAAVSNAAAASRTQRT